MENLEQTNPKRPVFLSVLCILTFIATGFGFLGLLLNLMIGKQSDSEIELANAQMVQLSNDMHSQGMDWLADAIQQASVIAAYYQTNFYAFQFIQLLCLACGLVGAIWMFKGRKIGFHLYIIYNLISLGSIYLFVPVSEVPAYSIVVNGLFSGLFISSAKSGSA